MVPWCHVSHVTHFILRYTNPSRLMWHANAWRLCSEAAWDDGESSHGCSSAQGRVGCHCSEPKLPGMGSKHYDSNIGERRKRILQYVAICFRMLREHHGTSMKQLQDRHLAMIEDSRNMSLHDTWTSQMLKVFIRDGNLAQVFAKHRFSANRRASSASNRLQSSPKAKII